jgi:hypothetical protein
MRRSLDPAPGRRSERSAVALSALVVITLLLAFTLTGCGVDGVYSMTNSESEYSGFTLTLDDGEFTMTPPSYMGEEPTSYRGTYTVEDDTISLFVDGKLAETGKVQGDYLVFIDKFADFAEDSALIWMKQ